MKLKRRIRAILVKQYHQDMYRYADQPKIAEWKGYEVWLKPSNVNNIWIKQVSKRYASFGVATLTGWWDGETFTPAEGVING
jgi:hypothetical protein